MNSPDQVPLEPLVISLDAASVKAALPAYHHFLAGRRSLLPLDSSPEGEGLRALMGAGPSGAPTNPGTLVACTSGSTGTPKGALLRSAGVRAAIAASATFLRNHTGSRPGPWLLALPPHHIAGTMVILRSLEAGHPPTVLDLQGGPFTARAFIDATDQLTERYPDQPLYTSLVPTQLARLLGTSAAPEAPTPSIPASATTRAVGVKPRHTGTPAVSTLNALRSYAAILVGGGPTSADLATQCRELGIPVFLTYGSSETAGGVVYNGEALPGYQVQITGTPEGTDNGHQGRVELSGPSVAEGYRATADLDPKVAADAFPRPGTFRTADLGELHHSVLTVLGRSDGAINSGGLKILPEQVEELLSRFGFTACATGVLHPEWGEAVSVLIEDATVAPGTDLSARVRETLGQADATAHLIPRHAFSTLALPRTGPGKLDRMRARAHLDVLLGQRPGPAQD